jgi:hypothetical protein
VIKVVTTIRDVGLQVNAVELNDGIESLETERLLGLVGISLMSENYFDIHPIISTFRTFGSVPEECR